MNSGTICLAQPRHCCGLQPFSHLSHILSCFVFLQKALDHLSHLFLSTLSASIEFYVAQLLFLSPVLGLTRLKLFSVSVFSSFGAPTKQQLSSAPILFLLQAFDLGVKFCIFLNQRHHTEDDIPSSVLFSLLQFLKFHAQGGIFVTRSISRRRWVLLFSTSKGCLFGGGFQGIMSKYFQ